MHCHVGLSSSRLSNVTMLHHFQILCQSVPFLRMQLNPSDVTFPKPAYNINIKQKQSTQTFMTVVLSQFNQKISDI